MKIDFNTKTTYCEDGDKYIKTKIKTYKDSKLQIFIIKMGLKNTRRKSNTQMFINNNFRFCYLCI